MGTVTFMSIFLLGLILVVIAGNKHNLQARQSSDDFALSLLMCESKFQEELRNTSVNVTRGNVTYKYSRMR